MEFGILGQMEVRDGDRVLLLRGSRERALLAYLLLHANEIVASDRLIDELWGSEPPQTVSTVLHVYVSRLRKLLGRNGDTLITQRPGYVLQIDPEQIDVQRFERLVEAGRRAHMQGDPAAAAATLREALALWRGPALADLVDAEWAQNEIARLEELRLAATEDRIEADLELGRHADVVGELEGLVARNPLRERLRAQLILALYRCGRHGEALQAYGEARRGFPEELGLEPSASLRRLEQAILVQDPALELAHGAPSVPATPETGAWRRRRRATMAAAVVVAAAAAAVTLALTLGRGGGATAGGPVAAVPDSVAVIDVKSMRIVQDIPLGGAAGGIAAGAGAVWVVDYDDGTLVRIDPRDARITRTVAVGQHPRSVTVGAGAVWVSGSDRLVRIDPQYVHSTGSTRLRQSIPGFPPSGFGYGTLGEVATGPAGVWVAHNVSAVSQIDPVKVTVRRNVVLDDAPVALAVGGDAVWVLAGGSGQLLSIDAATGQVSGKIALGAKLFGTSLGGGKWDDIAVGHGSVWVPSAHLLLRVDPLTGATTRIDTRDGSLGVAVAGDDVWVANYLAGTVSRIDARTNKVVGTIRTGNNPTELAVMNGRVWVTVN